MQKKKIIASPQRFNLPPKNFAKGLCVSVQSFLSWLFIADPQSAF